MMYQGRTIVCDAPERIKRLVSGELLELRTPQLKRAAAAVAALEGVLEVQTYGDLLHVFVDSVAGRQASLSLALGDAGLDVAGLRQIQPRMEEAFISLVRRQSAVPGGTRAEVE
jgi:ABC-2 type transport system ATP-binding protein